MNVSPSLSQLAVPPGVDVTVVIPVLDRYEPVRDIWMTYKAMMEGTGRTFEFCYVLDGPNHEYVAALDALIAQGENIDYIVLNRSFGETTCIVEGVKRARADLILTLPPFLQVEADAIPAVVSLAESVDVVVAARKRRSSWGLTGLRARGFELSARLAGSHYDDPGCNVRAIRRGVFDELHMQDDQHFFLPVLAERLGFSVQQLALPQAASDRRFRPYGPLVYLGRLLDIISMGFLASFMQKPFRFFGTIGVTFIAVGLAMGLFLMAERFFYDASLGDRPLLLLMVLLIVLGIQIAAVGLMADIVLFARNPRRSIYKIDKVVSFTED